MYAPETVVATHHLGSGRELQAERARGQIGVDGQVLDPELAHEAACLFALDDADGDPGLAVDRDLEPVAGELGGERIRDGVDVEAPGGPSLVVGLAHARVLGGEQSPYERAELLLEDRSGRALIGRAGRDAAPLGVEDGAAAEAGAALRRADDPGAGVVGDRLIRAGPLESKVSPGREGEAPALFVTALGAVGDEHAAQVAHGRKRCAHAGLDLGRACNRRAGDAGRLRGAGNTERKGEDRDGRSGRRDTETPAEPAPRPRQALDLWRAASLRGEPLVELPVEGWRVVGDVEPTQLGAELLVPIADGGVLAHRRAISSVGFPSARRSTARARFRREAIVPEGTPSTSPAAR